MTLFLPACLFPILYSFTPYVFMTSSITLSSYERFCQRFCVGLTGGIASGKSTAAEQFSVLGAGVVDTDVLAHQLTAGRDANTGLGAAMPDIIRVFGTECVNDDGSLNRAAMRAKVFASPQQRQRLEAIMHPRINALAQQQAANIVGEYVVFVVPLLIESAHWRRQVDRFAVVDCDESLQYQRLLARPGIMPIQAQQILAAQATRHARLVLANDVLDNAGDKGALSEQVLTLHTQYLQYAKLHRSNADSACLNVFA
jgi:dephospho-CoA kinase